MPEPNAADSSDDEGVAEVDVGTAARHLLSAEERESIGRKCKRLLDFCRAQYLRRLGYEVYLAPYCDKSITPENVALIARKPIVRSAPKS